MAQHPGLIQIQTSDGPREVPVFDRFITGGEEWAVTPYWTHGRSQPGHYSVTHEQSGTRLRGVLGSSPEDARRQAERVLANPKFLHKASTGRRQEPEATFPDAGPTAVIQEGLGLLATGRTLGEAALETARYLDEDVETVLANLTQRLAGHTPAYGEVYVVRCTEALRRTHDAQGLDTEWIELVRGDEIWAALLDEQNG